MADASHRNTELDPGNVNKALYDCAKRFWGWSITIKVSAAFAGVLSTAVLSETPVHLPFMVALAAIAAEVLQWRSDEFKGRAESLKRKLEYQDGFGWRIDGAEIADVLAAMTARTRARIAKKPSEAYFASPEAPGSRRVVENLRESAWWSKHLSASMSKGCVVILATTVAVSIAALYYAAISLPAFNDRQNAVRIVTTVLSLVVSVGLWRFLVGYSSFSKKAERYEQDAVHALKGEHDHIAALKLLHEYQVARASAPIIPDWVWKLRRNTLNELWELYCKANPATQLETDGDDDDDAGVRRVAVERDGSTLPS